MAAKNLLVICLICAGARLLLAHSIEALDKSETDLGASSQYIERIINTYHKGRADFIQSEVDSSFGSEIVLTEKEELANKIIMAAKEDELNAGFHNPHAFNPARHIFEVLDEIKQSKLFQIIQKMPKGGILHAHETAMCSADCLVNLTYWPDLWQRSTQNYEVKEFLFSRDQPTKHTADGSTWRLVKEIREHFGAAIYDERVRTLFTLYDKNADPRIQFKDINAVWRRFNTLFGMVKPILCYSPVRKEYFKKALTEMVNDGVQYLEFRGGLSKLYDLDGNKYTDDDIIKMYLEVIDEIKLKYPSFIGVKLIYAVGKTNMKEAQIAMSLHEVQFMHSRYPEFVAGFDVVGQEDIAPRLQTYAKYVLNVSKDIKFFFHAGETNWFGSIDENLIDAVLLGSRRIGHGFALAKHPHLIELVKKQDIAVEVNPISNQVLKLVNDMRNHPASVFFAENVPMVISSDDPSFWEVTPLSHDFYMAFLGIASRHSDLKTLKKLAENSIVYSSMTGAEQRDALLKWQVNWDKFIDAVITTKGNFIN